MSHPLIAACYAAAWRYLAKAEEAEELALEAALSQYKAAHRGAFARARFTRENARRAALIEEAQRCRRQIRELRALIARAATEDTIPPAPESSTRRAS